MRKWKPLEAVRTLPPIGVSRCYVQIRIHRQVDPIYRSQLKAKETTFPQLVTGSDPSDCWPRQ